MTFQSYALTYSQLVIQAVQKNYDPVSLARLRRAHETAMRLLDGFYRFQDTPFICHLIRTASIVMKHNGSVDTVLVSLLHAVYMFGQFRDGKVGGISNSHRKEIQDVVGREVEDSIIDYMKLKMHDPDFLKTQIKNRSSLHPKELDMLFIGLANELEDFLDLQMAFQHGNRHREIIEKNSALLIELARVLGHFAIAEELEATFEEYSHESIPDLMKFDQGHAYELTEHLRMRKGEMHFFLSKMKQRLKNSLR